MAENEDGAEKKHEPGKNMEKAAEKGQLPKSQEAASAVVVMAGGASIVLAAGPMSDAVVGLSMEMFAMEAPYVMDMGAALDLGNLCMIVILKAIWIPLVMVLVAGVGYGVAQTGGRFTPAAMEPDLNKFNAFKQFKSMYLDKKVLVEFAKSLLMVFVLSSTVWYAMRPQLAQVPEIALLGPEQLVPVLIGLVWRMLLYCFPVLLLIAVADYSYQSYDHYENMKRTDQEVKEEAKDAEGNPEVKAEMRRRMRDIIQGQMLSDVKKADVVVTNPTHYAVALKYNRMEDAAPTVLAKGVDKLALKIRNEALRYGIPRIENRPLARALYARVKAGQMIPEDLFGPVANVLALIYRRREHRKNAAA